MIWLCIGIALGGFWIGSVLTAILYIIGCEANNFKVMSIYAGDIRYISALLAAIFIAIGIMVIK